MADPGRNGNRTEFKVVGRRDIPQRLASHICSGFAKYDSDILLPNMLFGKVMRSPYGHARIKSMDTSKAEALEGVKAVIRWDDPEIKAMGTIPIYLGLGGVYPNEWVLDSEARHEDDEVGVCVAAETEELCDKALKLIADTIEWEVLPCITDCLDADKTGAPIIRPDLTPGSNLWKEDKWEEGDVATGFAAATHIVEYDIAFNQMCNYYPQPASFTSKWEQSDASSEGKTLYMTGCDMRRQNTDAPRKVFGLSEDKIRSLNTYAAACY
jgi:xanthine dehydrogenase molybdenum-binding subunit